MAGQGLRGKEVAGLTSTTRSTRRGLEAATARASTPPKDSPSCGVFCCSDLWCVPIKDGEHLATWYLYAHGLVEHGNLAPTEH